MSKSSRSSVVALVLLLALVLPPTVFAQKGKVLNRKDPTPRGVFSGELIIGLTTANVLIAFNSSTPGSIGSLPITGLQAGENVLGIDFRPLTRQLYALGSTSRIYTINMTSGAATAVNGPFTPVLSGTAFGVDFNPLVDLIRVTSDANQNLRLNPNTGTVAAVDTNLNPGDPNVVGSAYTNNFAGATSTTLYDIDSTSDQLFIQNPPNNGTLTLVGNLGFDTSDLVGFDISRASSIAYTSLTPSAAASSALFTINLATGAATLVGAIGGGVTIRDISVAPVAQAGDLLISEFRLSGPGGPNDEFVEIYNPSTQPLTVAAFDGSSGFALAASDGVARFTIPNGTVIPARGHYLGANLSNSLSNYPAGNGTTATGDAVYTTEIPDNTGIALFNTSNAFTLPNRLDAVGSATEANTIYKEGTGYPAIAGNNDHSFFRNLRTGLPQDTNNNFASGAAEPHSATPQNDFVYAVPTRVNSAAGARLGAPGPENLSSPIQRNSSIKASLVAPCMSSSAAPNRVRTGSGNSGTLELRRKFTNNTAGAITRLRFRIVDVTTFNAAPTFADLNAVTSTNSSEAQPCGAGTINLTGLTLETPPHQPFGGGFNSTLSAGTITLATPLAAGASIDVNFLLNVTLAGTFRFFVNVEALP